MVARDITDIDFTDLVDLEEHGPDTYVGVSARYPWGVRLFGGQVIAQALKAAASTVDADRPVHSLHAYFIRPGTHDEPVRYEVERLRNGRSFSTRQVVARQSGGAILTLSASFQIDETEADVETVTLPDVGGPDDPTLPDHSWGSTIDRKAVDFEDGHVGYWIRLAAATAPDPIDTTCALAFLSDAAPSRAARSSHPDFTGRWDDHRLFQGASLDHSMWFHRPCDPTEWHWFDTRSHGLSGGRGLVTGDVVSRSGRHVATIAQQVLLRRRRD